MIYPTILKNLLAELQKLPGIGLKTAERLAFYILKASDEDIYCLADTIRAVKEKVKKCRYCYNITEEDPCPICSNPSRDHSIICVVEQPKDLLAIEKSGTYQGTYHVLMGRLAPLDNEHAEYLTIDALDSTGDTQAFTPDGTGNVGSAGGAGNVGNAGNTGNI